MQFVFDVVFNRFNWLINIWLTNDNVKYNLPRILGNAVNAIWTRISRGTAKVTNLFPGTNRIEHENACEPTISNWNTADIGQLCLMPKNIEQNVPPTNSSGRNPVPVRRSIFIGKRRRRRRGRQRLKWTAIQMSLLAVVPVQLVMLVAASTVAIWHHRNTAVSQN